MTLRCPSCERYFPLNTPECPGCGGPLEKEIFSMLPTTEGSDLQVQSPVERAAQSEFDARLLEMTPQAYVSWTILAINLLIYVVMIVSGVAAMEPAAEPLLAWGADYGPLTLHGQWWRILTSMFVHAGFFHLACNMVGLYFWAPLVERLYGNGTFLLIYLFSGATGSLASLFFHPQVVSVGASGALLGLVGALGSYLVFQGGSLNYAVTQPIWYSLGPIVFYSFQEGRKGEINIAAHLGGLLGGAVIGAIVARPFEASRPPLSWLRLMGGTVAAVLCVVGPYVWLADRRIEPSTEAPFAMNDAASITAWFLGEAHRLETLEASLIAAPPVSSQEREAAAVRLQRECLEGWQSALLRLNLASVRGVGPFNPAFKPYAELRQEEIRLQVRQLRNPAVSLRKEIEQVHSRLRHL